MNELETVFNHLDANGDDKISADELDNVLWSLKSGVSPEDLHRVMEDLDTDCDSFISFTKFAAFCRSDASIDGKSNEFRDAFDLYNRDKNGLISAAELQLVLNRLGLKCSIDKFHDMIKSVNANGGGCINFEEFKTMMTTSKNCGGTTNGSIH
ncbi:putative calcium-binding protein CML26 [Glycine soja]|uniref:EF-hand domain-containing protein n=1 Tax=Glycine max TaxID=3847 RepID=I1MSK4_SOYBN|nr:probable calcium-binding protein CML26 [Glycine max]KAH1116995.1 hypothetical protein GYH30_046382 [Glycine max]KAH1201225.1 putative calcium-binding protein CML26 [Glycine max]|eukprot:XP_003550642.1 probable calcium-binding protein CML26 [Glycine max]